MNFFFSQKSLKVKHPILPGYLFLKYEIVRKSLRKKIKKIVPQAHVFSKDNKFDHDEWFPSLVHYNN